jgi:MFS family permease
VLALLEGGLSFTEIGLCIAARELSANAFEIPSGAIADVYGRRRSMVAAFSVYTLALLLFGLSSRFWSFAFAMAMWGLGDAFRSGTHKAMILEWLRLKGRLDEKVQVFGYTRSWSKIGSAVSAPIAAWVVWFTGSFSWVFWLSTLPYLANIANLSTYPASLDAIPKQQVRSATKHVGETVRYIYDTTALRRLVVEGMTFQGTYAATKDYLQPVLQGAALTLPILVAADEVQRTALLVGAVYSVLFVLAAVASRQAHRFSAAGTQVAARRIWWMYTAALVALTLFLSTSWVLGAVIAFMGIAALQNVFRPILVSRFDDASEPRFGATLLSMEAQAGSVATLVLAPVIGAAVDQVGSLWPVGAIGAAMAAVIVVGSLRRT